MLAEFINLNIYTYFLVFARVGSAISVLPGFSSAWVPVRMRLVIAIGICFVITPPLARYLPPLAATPIELALMIMGEIIIGLYFGAIGVILIACLQSAGSFIALFSSLANAMVRDPIADQQSSLISGFLSLVGLLLVIVTDTHHLMLRALVDSYGLFEPGKVMVGGDAVHLIARKVADSFDLLSGPRNFGPVDADAANFLHRVAVATLNADHNLDAGSAGDHDGVHEVFSGRLCYVFGPVRPMFLGIRIRYG